jgi:signal transduction histidine kinase
LPSRIAQRTAGALLRVRGFDRLPTDRYVPLALETGARNHGCGVPTDATSGLMMAWAFSYACQTSSAQGRTVLAGSSDMPRQAPSATTAWTGPLSPGQELQPAGGVTPLPGAGEHHHVAAALVARVVDAGAERKRLFDVSGDATEERQREQELRAALVASSELTSELTHELSTRLTVIIVSLTRSSVAGTTWPTTSGAISCSGSVSTRAGSTAMLRRMLLAGTPTSPVCAHPEPVELWEVALSHLPDLGVSSVRIDCPRDLRVMADPAYLDEIVVNLVENADKYGAPPITVSARQVGKVVELTVSDCGSGVPEGFTPRLFER